MRPDFSLGYLLGYDYLMDTKEQQIMEQRYTIPYNWALKPWSRSFRKKQGLWAVVSKVIGDMRGAKVLDVGCGDGWHTARMVQAGAEVTGIDYSKRSIAFARLIVPAAFEVASGTDIPFPNDTFDIVVSLQTIEHIPISEAHKMASELLRVVKPGGRVVVSVPSVRRPLSAAHFQHFTQDSLEQLFGTGAMTVVGQERSTLFLRILERCMENRFYVLFKVSDFFTKRMYAYWNETKPSLGNNLVAVFQKRLFQRGGLR